MAAESTHIIFTFAAGTSIRVRTFLAYAAAHGRRKKPVRTLVGGNPWDCDGAALLRYRRFAIYHRVVCSHLHSALHVRFREPGIYLTELTMWKTLVKTSLRTGF